MKSLSLKVKLEEINGVETVVTSHTLLKTAINQAPQNGFNVDEMMVRIELLKKIDEHKELFNFSGKKKEEIDMGAEAVVEFEDSDFRKLREIFSECKWASISQLIVDINNDLKE